MCATHSVGVKESCVVLYVFMCCTCVRVGYVL